MGTVRRGRALELHSILVHGSLGSQISGLRWQGFQGVGSQLLAWFARILNSAALASADLG